MYKVYFITFGCKVNHYETECMKELFRGADFAIADSPEGADAVVINSCTVTSSGDSRALAALRRTRAALPDAVIALTGCYPQANREEAEQLPEADIIAGTKHRSRIAGMVQSCLAERRRIVELSDYSSEDIFEPLKCTRFDSNTRAFVKIQDGCNQFCSYCMIPYARGRCRSKPLDVLRSEVRAIAEGGVKEIVLSGINLAFYGREFGADLADAAEICAATEGIERIRLSSLEPEMMSEQLLTRLRALPQFCPQFHLSLQSGCERTLKAMNRRYTAAEYLALTEHIRSIFPDCSFTTDVMVGFPQETDEDHAESVDFVRRVGFAKVHVFRYSRRKGTKADKMSGQVPESVKTLRWQEMTAAAEEKREEYLRAQVGKTVPVLFEREKSPEFHRGYAPDYTLIKISRKNPEKSLRNQIISVIIEECGHDCCFGSPVGDLY
ncbi:tRNA (N(6)-L-threonylcarbamoyladenosine(37)-C(2))-methylthiotransferase MtaB [Ruminococcus flavefaciens]|uniref:Threonylcarbamoyladenosine tRNA methylthiotransferase MtaB n=1 Tax=Ruminococcus flavefaciens TaxID=1265 RepID=A0A315XW58_RUMFL|nr:tRNA (N(6)-L-threonylcarbamoyladenosine(37)-C(2))-methylthiotransferase MtaB [Ruminococcus flavefaciens]PWJ11509.1 threonylcarbamoyladenosine tRNA methylthiotransferase MtaB [Ruminococcus flavefaciens]SSA50418.1 threonylcarbamoyladenosine tRNA methylthiotransferase MtaB [Ruminococcus flavefaciens]